jgi:hypothetical protein
MTALTTWQTDDPCPRCGAHLTEISGPSSTRVIQQCRACAWSVTWAALQMVLTAAQSDCLADMAADAIAYRRAVGADCLHCPQGPAGGCPEHRSDYALIESYRQLAADLISARGGQ